MDWTTSPVKICGQGKAVPYQSAGRTAVIGMLAILLGLWTCSQMSKRNITIRANGVNLQYSTMYLTIAI